MSKKATTAATTKALRAVEAARRSSEAAARRDIGYLTRMMRGLDRRVARLEKRAGK